LDHGPGAYLDINYVGFWFLIDKNDSVSYEETKAVFRKLLRKIPYLGEYFECRFLYFSHTTSMKLFMLMKNVVFS